MVTKTKIIFFIFVFSLAGCSQFQDVFKTTGETSYKVSKKSKERKESTKLDDSSSGGGREPIVTKKGTYYFVVSGDTLSAIAETYHIKPEDLAQINSLYDSNLVIGRRLFIPNKKNRHEYLAVTNVIKDEKTSQVVWQKKVNFIWPVDKFVLFSNFGQRHGRPHNGVDLSASVGTPIHASASGKVIYSKRFAGYGNLIVIKHADQYFTAYAHTQEIFVSEGKTVKQGDKIATIGRTGRTTGPHLHFEVHKGTEAVNPITVLPEHH